MNIQEHLLKKHQGQLDEGQAAIFGLKICSCQRLCRSITKHQRKGCPDITPRPTQQSPATPLDTSTDNRVQRLFSILRNDAATEEDVEAGYDILTTLPHTPRLWRPLEIKQLRRTYERLCTVYNTLQRPVDILRILAVPKLGATPLMTKNRLGELTRRLAKYPYLDDENAYITRMNKYHTTGRSKSPLSLPRQIHKLLTQGRLGAASRRLTPGLGVAENTPETIAKLRQLHPEEDIHEWTSTTATPLRITREMIARSLNTVNPETAGGPSGLDGRTLAALKHSKPVLDFLTTICNKICNNDLRLTSLFTGARLSPLRKPNNGVRPLAVGEMIYRLCMKSICRAIDADLHPWQLGVSVKGGVEPLLHYLQKAGQTEHLIAIDLRNAFNSMKRSLIYDAVRERAPGLLPTFLWAYQKPSKLFISGGNTLWSSCGVRQGDPLGPLLFSLGFAKILGPLHDKLRSIGVSTQMPVMAYLDDTLIAVEPKHAAQAQEIIENTFASHLPTSGLQLRPEKTKVLTPETYRTKGLEVLGGFVGSHQDEFVQGKLR